MDTSFDLPLTADGDRTFMCTLGPNTFGFRSYYVDSSSPAWYLDVYNSQYQPLAVGRRLVIGSINALKGFANELSQVAVVVYKADGLSAPEDALGTSLRVMWFPSKVDDPLVDGDPMSTLYENFYIAQ